jgi:hypothetical protein
MSMTPHFGSIAALAQRYGILIDPRTTFLTPAQFTDLWRRMQERGDITSPARRITGIPSVNTWAALVIAALDRE